MNLMEHTVLITPRHTSVCPDCFQTISSPDEDANGEANENTHRCPEMMLKETLSYFRVQPVPVARKWAITH
jgi:hypothetical protein